MSQTHIPNCCGEWQIQSFGNTTQEKAKGATWGQCHSKAPLDTRLDLILALKLI